ncbi:uncharacterized protein LOC18102110 [Populus trichocarpa]|uniref:uncharacterized protein LOC18102110 n=1 Tax=Populus trichocarpa TaxID=3694 RepID=UPI0022784984|nr:uncharacterized protein LOC18102110 [Populus trichocarpa]
MYKGVQISQCSRYNRFRATCKKFHEVLLDLANHCELLDSMQAGKLEPEVAFLNASLIPDVFPLLAAAHKTLIASRDSLATRTFHSELVYNYSGSKHITESLERCVISNSTTYILAARVNASPDEPKYFISN